MKNSESFLSTYNKLDHYLKGLDPSDHYRSFSSVLNRLKESNKVVSHYEKKLKSYNNLRNAIVHERMDGKVIAEPNDYAVNDLNSIYMKISSPRSICDVCKHNIIKLNHKDSLSTALTVMKENDFSQLPVYNGDDFVEMLNTETVSSWMAHNIEQDTVSIQETKVSDVLCFKSDYRVTLFHSRDTNIYEILELYKDNAYNSKQIDAIIITHNGKKTEKPITIITDYDIPVLLETI
ncbi:MAG: CBS domain-containing protein [Clostridiales bacterium]|nr:CBS domain-containing protein [Clostridiales bacterium]